jgi:hypothetical protein
MTEMAADSVLSVVEERVVRGSTDRKTAFFMYPKKGGGSMNASPDPNSFGLPVGRDGSCGGNATDWCVSVCYADPWYPAVRDLLDANWVEYQKRKRSVQRLVDMLMPVVGESAGRAVKRGVPHVFRWFWAGDVPGRNFAKAIRRVAGFYYESKFWLYTRNFDAVPELWAPNVTVYLSVDRDNVDAALNCKKNNPWVRLAFCGDTWDETEGLAARFDGERKGPRCPELVGKLPMVVWGNGGTGHGACVECDMCINGINNVRFAAQKGM